MDIIAIENSQKLLDAIKKNNTKLAIELINNPNINLNFYSFVDHHTPLIYAVVKKNIKVINKLLKKGVDIDFTTNDRYQMNALLFAVYHSHINIAEKLIEKGANLDIRQFGNGYTALMLAINYGHNSIAEKLIKAGANLDIQQYDDGESALILAIQKKRNKIAEMLINRGANLDFKEYNNRTALMIAIENFNNKIAKLLIDAGSNLDITDKNGNNALLIALNYNNKTIYKYLLKKNPKYEIHKEYKKTLNKQIKNSTIIDYNIAKRHWNYFKTKSENYSQVLNSKEESKYRSLNQLAFTTSAIKTLSYVDPKNTDVINTIMRKFIISKRIPIALSNKQYFQSYSSIIKHTLFDSIQKTTDKSILLTIATDMGIVNTLKERGFFQNIDINTQKKILINWINTVINVI